MARPRRGARTHRFTLRPREKPTVPPIIAKKDDVVVFSGGAAGRIYFFPDAELFGVECLHVNAGRRATRKIRGAAGLYRYAVWDNAFEDFLEGSSSPIIIVQS